MTPNIIKLPFWDMTQKNENAFHANVNWAKESEPEQLKGRTLAVTGDLGKVMRDLKFKIV